MESGVVHLYGFTSESYLHSYTSVVQPKMARLAALSLILATAALGAAVVRRLEGLQVLLGTGGFGLITLIALYVPSRV